MNSVQNIIENSHLTYEQKVISLAREAENSFYPLGLSKEIEEYRSEGVICDLGEGNAPYRPRYIVPDYELFMHQGSDFLEIDPPKTLEEAVFALLALYNHVPSITGFPVYIGNLDTLLNPFVSDAKKDYPLIYLFLRHIDRTITDSFCHANIGPEKTLAGELILKASKELNTSTPNISFKWDDSVDESFTINAIDTALSTAKPSFANNKMFQKELGKYGIVSCYNGLYIGGGSFTLVRLNIAELAKKASSVDDFLKNVLPKAVKLQSEYMDKRIDYLVNRSRFFESSFLVKESLINKDRFSAMFGMFGLAEGVNHLLKATELQDRFGHNQEADNLGVAIIQTLEKEVFQHKNTNCSVSDNHFLLHAQVGIDTDNGISPGCRIPIGEEPQIWEHLQQAALFHPFFPSGIGDIFCFDQMSKKNPKAILDIIKGAFGEGMRYLSLYAADSDVIRITGYLVKKSEIEKLQKGEAVLRDTTALGLGNVEHARTLERKVRKNV
ncbi:MAG: YjjI family glycine radical enzyme [Spirochaetes bacterium]|nr:YjjI family glycine radical enzyme [Spirochaetota bacterium]